MSILNDPQFDQVAHQLEIDRGIPVGSLRAVAMQESGGRADADSGKAHGLMQFTPATAQQYNVDTSNPWDSLRGAADYLGDLNQQHSGNFNAALAAYNGGTKQGQLVQAGQQPSYPETANYVQQVNARMSQATPDTGTVINAVQNNIAGWKSDGRSDTYVVQQLLKSPVGDAVTQARTAGLTDSDIVQRMGGQPLATVQAAQQKVEGQGFLTNLAQGAGNAVSDMSNGAQQIGARLSGDDAQLKQLQTQQAATNADPTRQALGNTAGGMIGNAATKAAPYIVAGAVAPEGLLPALAVNGAVGGAEGALTPTTGDGQFAHNVASGAGWGAVGGGTGNLVGRGLAGAASKFLDSDAQAAGRIATGQSEGLPVSVASASGPNSFWRNVAEGMPENGAVKGFQAQADQAVAGKVAEGLGVPGYTGAIDTNLLNAARPAIKQALDDATNVYVTLPKTLRGDLDTMISSGSSSLTQGIANNAVVKQAAENLSHAADTGALVNGRDLQALSSELKGLTYSQTASHGEKVLAGQMVGKIDGLLKSGMSSDQAAAYDAANAQYRNLLAVQRMVKASNDTGVVTPRQMLNAVKTGSTSNAFLSGDAPFQDLAGTASDLYGPAAGKGLGSMLAKATGGDHSLAAAAILEPHAGLPVLAAKKLGGSLLGKLASSTNPTLVRLLSGASGVNVSPEMQAYIAKALGSVGAGVGGSQS